MWIALIALAFLTACATAPRPGPIPIEIEELRATDSWRATYTLPRATTELRFAREVRAPLRAAWTVIEPAGATWRRDADMRETLVLPAPASRVVLEFATTAKDLEKDYNLNLTFTDGSRLLYTGHFPLEGVGARFTFRTGADRDIRVLDQHGRGSLHWQSNNDTYVYFGSIQPVAHERMTLIVDPGLPSWIERQMRELAPKQLDYFAPRVGEPLNFKPLVLLSYVGDQSSGLSFKGGTLPGLVQIAIDGKGWTTETPTGTELWYSRLAHEIFHLWNGQQFPHADEAEWLSEASADMAALLAMRDNGVIDANRFDRLVVGAANECIIHLQGQPMLKANPRTFYACGVVTQLMAGEEPWAVYRRVFPGGYDNAEYFAALKPERRELIAQLVERGLTRPADEFLAEQLRNAGIDVTRVKPEDAIVSQNATRAMLADTIRRCACRTSLPQCQSLGPVEKVGDVDARREPAKAQAALLGGETRVTIGGSAVTMNCTPADADPTFTTLLHLQSRARIEIEELPSDTWRATYRFSRPLQRITFSRERGPLRTTWKVVEPAGAAWKTEGDRESLVLAAPSDRLVLEFATNSADREKDYNLNIAFTDGSRLLYTGHFLIDEADESPWTFRTAPERDVRLLDRHGRGSLEWPGGDETYVYFGSVAPVVTDRMTLLVDRGLPSWIETRIRALAPKQLDYFAKQLGRELSFKPLVFLSYVDDQSPGISFKGGTLTGLVQIAVTGQGWATENAEAAEKWYSRLSHEIFHLYNAHEFEHDREGEWLAEASADAAALRAMRDNGVIDAAREKQLVVEAANECIVRLEGKPILKGASRTFYACGLLTQLLAGDDVFAVYRKMFKPNYTTADFLANARHAARIEEFVRRGPSGPTDVYVASLLHDIGIDVTRVPPDQATATQNITRFMLIDSIRRCACRTSLPQCTSLGRVEKVGDLDARRFPPQARAALLAGESDVTVDGQVVTMHCTPADVDPTYSLLLRVR